MNTKYQIEAVDAQAFITAWDLSGKCEGLKVGSLKDNHTITILFSRYEMDSNGSFVGYLHWSATWKTVYKRDLNINSFPNELSAKVVIPKSFDVQIGDHPKEREYHDEDCPRFDNDSKECECHNCEGYHLPEDDFLYDEVLYTMAELRYPMVTFDRDTRSWELGDAWFEVKSGKFNTDFPPG